ncbi:MAG: glycosyltransferase [Sphingobacteriales bacterium]|nr:MAG: glycosyltransferase [Sphingobacteriales bacterium]
MKNAAFDIFILTMCRWDDVYSSTIFSLAKELSKTHRVFYIDHPFTLKDFISKYRTPRIQTRKQALLKRTHIYRKIEGLPENFTVVTPGLTLSINALPEGKLYNFLSTINDRIVKQCIRQTILDYGVKDFVFINSFDPYYCRSLPTTIQPVLHVYQSTDDISQEKYIARHGIRLEQEALQKAGLNIATSRELTRKLSEQGLKIHYLPNAANFDLFHLSVSNKYEVPTEIKEVWDTQTYRHIVGYIGDISSLRIDFGLIEYLAKAMPEKLFVFIGKKQCTDEELQPLPNLLFIPPKPIEQLPAYLQYFDCCIIPFLCNTLTRSIYPLKLNEYLSAGKPVVSTPFSEDIRMFGQIAHLTNSPVEFALAIQDEISENNETKAIARIEVAKMNSWTVRAKELLRLIGKHLPFSQPNSTSYNEAFETIH